MSYIKSLITATSLTATSAVLLAAATCFTADDAQAQAIKCSIILPKCPARFDPAGQRNREWCHYRVFYVYQKTPWWKTDRRAPGSDDPVTISPVDEGSKYIACTTYGPEKGPMPLPDCWGPNTSKNAVLATCD
jgi:hypothetical protein